MSSADLAAFGKGDAEVHAVAGGGDDETAPASPDAVAVQGELQIADGGGTVESVPRHVGVAVREDEGGGPPQDRILPGAESRCHMAVFSGKRRHPVRHAGGQIVQPVAAFHQQPCHFLTVGRRRRVAGLFQRLSSTLRSTGSSLYARVERRVLNSMSRCKSESGASSTSGREEGAICSKVRAALGQTATQWPHRMQRARAPCRTSTDPLVWRPRIRCGHTLMQRPHRMQ